MATNKYGNPTTVPAIPDVRGGATQAVLSAIKEWIEVRQGARGDGLDRAVTFRDLLNAEIATPGAIQGLGGVKIPPIPLETGGGDNSPIPPTPTNLAAAGAVRTIILTWDFARGYLRHSHFEVWRAETDALGDAVLIAQVYEPMYTDDVGPGAKYYYWVRAVSDAGHSNFNAVSGTLGETAPNIEEIIEGLEGEITESHLHQHLGQRINATEALANNNRTWLNTVAQQVEDNVVAIQQEAATRQTEDGKLFAQYTVKIDAYGRVAGFGLASGPPDENGVSSSFAVRADRFYIAPPEGAGTGEMPFIVQTTPTTLNGVSVPPGVYMRNAFIMNGVITNAKIGDLAVDDAKIANMNVSKLRAGKLSVGAYIESTNYQSGATGFIIHANGNAEFQNATVRGTVYATAGTIGGVRIENYGLRTTNYNGSTAGWSINAAGDVHFTNGTFRGHIQATSGTFSGALQAATGTFSGSLSAATGTFSGRVHAGEFTAGSYTSWNWPSGTGVGVYLGPNGLRMGNRYNTSGYAEIHSNGNIYTPGFQIENGVMTVHAANIIDTLQLRGGAVSTTYFMNGSGSLQLYSNVPAKAIAVFSVRQNPPPPGSNSNPFLAGFRVSSWSHDQTRAAMAWPHSVGDLSPITITTASVVAFDIPAGYTTVQFGSGVPLQNMMIWPFGNLSNAPATGVVFLLKR